MEDSNYKKGYLLALENARNLFSSAEVIAEKNQYGLAISLLVLSAEESVKSYTIITQDFFPEKKIENYDKAFENHKFKLEAIRSLVGYSKIIGKMNDLIWGDVIKNIDEPIDELAKIKSEGVKKAVEWLNYQSTPESKSSQLSIENEWWRQAKALKEDGFYVRSSGKGWHTPANSKKEQYLKTRKYVSKFIDGVEILKDVDFNSEQVKKWIEEMKKIIKNGKKNEN